MDTNGRAGEEKAGRRTEEQRDRKEAVRRQRGGGDETDAKVCRINGMY